MPPDDSFLAQIDSAASAVREKWPVRPKAGLVLGTGSGQIAEQLQVELRLPFEQIPYFPRSTALGHRGSLVCGRLAGEPVVAMQGRFHLYEGYSVDQTTLPIHVMQRLGIQQLLISNAAGGVNPAFQVGELMFIESHIDLFWRTSMHGRYASNGITMRPALRADAACDEALIRQATARAQRIQCASHRGVYVGLLGPTYETRAEYRMCRRIGGDAVGMSTLPEIATASFYGIPTLAVSIITNLAPVNGSGSTSGHAVIAAAETAAQHLLEIFAQTLRT